MFLRHQWHHSKSQTGVLIGTLLACAVLSLLITAMSRWGGRQGGAADNVCSDSSVVGACCPGYVPFSAAMLAQYTDLSYPLPRTPDLAVDVIVQVKHSDGAAAGIRGVILCERKKAPLGVLAIPGGFVDYGESVESAAIREMREETGIDLSRPTASLRQYRIESNPLRDKRRHTASAVFDATIEGDQSPVAADDAKECKVFAVADLMLMERSRFAFDHHKILTEFFAYKGYV